MPLKIGQFAKIGMVSVSMLRYYDEMGLLHPAEIDRWTGYRYYAFEQLPLLNRILALKDLGLALDQIRQLLREELPAEQIKGMLRLKQAELQGQGKEISERLARIETRLLQIEMEGKMSNDGVVIKRVEPMRAAVLYDTIPDMDAVNQSFNRLFDEAMGYVMQNGGSFDSPPFDMWFDMGGEGAENIRVAVVVPTSSDLPPNERIKIEEVPGAEHMAAIVHHGPFATLGQSYGALIRWVEDNGYHIAGAAREIYLQYERDGDQSKYVTELQFPVEANS